MISHDGSALSRGRRKQLIAGEAPTPQVDQLILGLELGEEPFLRFAAQGVAHKWITVAVVTRATFSMNPRSSVSIVSVEAW